MVKSRSAGMLYRHPVRWLLPMILMLGLFYAYPLFDVIRNSFTSATLLKPDSAFTFNSYIKVFSDPDILNTFRITFTFTFSNIVAQLVLGMLFALLFNSGLKHRFPLTIFSRTMVLISWMIPGVLVGLVWRLILASANFGVANYLIELLGFQRINFLVRPDSSLISVICVNIWRGTAFSMIMFFAGLQKIPEELYEAAVVDGASVFTRFRSITLPMLRPVVFVTLVLVTIYTFNTFDMIMALTAGGPANSTEVLTLTAYKQMFKFFSIGASSAVAVVLLGINMSMAVIYSLFVLRESGTDAT